jgi:hypothetical protein
MAYEIESNNWIELKPKGTAPEAANTDAAFYKYDPSLDTVVAIHFKGQTPGVFTYNPQTNSWADPVIVSSKLALQPNCTCVAPMLPTFSPYFPRSLLFLGVFVGTSP